jgi:hypothetical protein
MGRNHPNISMGRVTVATFNAEPPAKVVRDRLEQNGVAACIVDERNVQRFWFLSKQYAGVRVKVEKPDFDRASDLLEKLDLQEGIMSEAIRCPQCDSSRVEYPQMTRYFILPTLLAQVGHLLGIIKYRFYCRTCQHTWVPRPMDIPPEKVKKTPKTATGN